MKRKLNSHHCSRAVSLVNLDTLIIPRFLICFQGSGDSRQERGVPGILPAPARGEPPGSVREFPLGSLQSLQHTGQDLRVGELPLLRQSGWESVPPYHSNEGGEQRITTGVWIVQLCVCVRLLKCFLFVQTFSGSVANLSDSKCHSHSTVLVCVLFL